MPAITADGRAWSAPGRSLWESCRRSSSWASWRASPLAGSSDRPVAAGITVEGVSAVGGLNAEEAQAKLERMAQRYASSRSSSPPRSGSTGSGRRPSTSAPIAPPRQRRQDRETPFPVRGLERVCCGSSAPRSRPAPRPSRPRWTSASSALPPRSTGRRGGRAGARGPRSPRSFRVRPVESSIGRQPPSHGCSARRLRPRRHSAAGGRRLARGDERDARARGRSVTDRPVGSGTATHRGTVFTIQPSEMVRLLQPPSGASRASESTRRPRRATSRTSHGALLASRNADFAVRANKVRVAPPGPAAS